MINYAILVIIVILDIFCLWLLFSKSIWLKILSYLITIAAFFLVAILLDDSNFDWYSKLAVPIVMLFALQLAHFFSFPMVKFFFPKNNAMAAIFKYSFFLFPPFILTFQIIVIFSES